MSMFQKFNSNRIIYYDFIRTFAIFGILACHCFGGLVVNVKIFNTNLWYYALFLNSLRDMSIPLFVTITGALLITKKDSLSVFIKKRFNRVIIPYIFWVAIFIIFWIAFHHVKSPVDFILKTILIPPTGPGVIYWFVQMILVVYLIIFILNKLIDINKVFLKVALLICILFVFLLSFNIIPGVPRPYNYIYFSIFAIFGFYLKSYDFTKNKIAESLKMNEERLVVVFFIISILLYLMEVYFNAINSIHLNSYTAVSQYGILNIALVISVFLFFRYFSESKGKFNSLFNYIANNKIGELIFSISFCSYGIYLSHKIIMDSILKVGIKNYFSPSIFYTLLLFATLIISWIIILMMSKVPYLKKVCGV